MQSRHLADPWLAGGGGHRGGLRARRARRGITTFDAADVYASTRAEEVLGRVLEGARRQGLECEETMKRIDEALGAIIVRDPSLTQSPAKRP